MKLEVQQYSKSIYDAGVWDSDTEAVVWDFYVTHALCGSSSQRRNVSEYAIRELPYNEMISLASIDQDSCEMLLADNIDGVLSELDLVIEQGKGDNKRPKEIDVGRPRFACIQPYTIKNRGKPQAKNSKAETLLTHIRNSLAHGNTFWLPNKKVLLIDKGGGASGKTTAAILLNSRTLLDWISLIDKNNNFYIIGKCANFASKKTLSGGRIPAFCGGCCAPEDDVNVSEAIISD